MSPDALGYAVLLAGVFLVLGKLLRLSVPAFQKLFLPSSILGGFLALLLGPQALGKLLGDESYGLFSEPTLTVWAEMPGLLISIVFATLFLGKQLPSTREVWELGGPQLSLGMIMGAGQYVIGILLAVLLLGPLFGLPPMVGALIEIGFEGGHGTAGGMQETFRQLGFEAGGDLAIGLATIGVLSGVIFGIILVNWGARRGKTAVIEDVVDTSKVKLQGLFDKENRDPAGFMTVRPSSIEPLSIHFGLTAIAVLIGAAILEGLQLLENATWGAGSDVRIMTYVPLFPLAMLGGLLLQSVLNRIDEAGILDRGMIVRLQGLALDLLIVSAIAALNLTVIATYLVPFLILAAAGIAWNVGVFLFLGPRIIPSFWFERGLADLGQSLGVTATGLLLLRIADPDNQTPAYESFGYKQLGFEPFFGGGLITGLSVPLIAQLGPWPFFGAMLVVLGLGLAFGLLYFGRMEPVAQAKAEELRSA